MAICNLTNVGGDFFCMTDYSTGFIARKKRDCLFGDSDKSIAGCQLTLLLVQLFEFTSFKVKCVEFFDLETEKLRSALLSMYQLEVCTR